MRLFRGRNMQLSDLKNSQTVKRALVLITALWLVFFGFAIGVQYAGTEMKDEICINLIPKINNLSEVDYFYIPVNHTNLTEVNYGR